MLKAVLVAGARPNFMKIAPLIRAIAGHNASGPKRVIQPLLVHTGQHYDYEMSKVFFEELELGEPDIYMGIGSGTHAEQTGKAMVALEKVLMEHKPDLVVVVGDVNSTLAGALAAVKLHIPLAHVEAGLRLFDNTVPEEVNRRLTDAVADYLFTHSIDANQNLLREGVDKAKIFLAGNVMIDSLLYNEEKARRRDVASRAGLENGKYGVLTLHRPDNVDDENSLKTIISALGEIAHRVPIAFPCHPRTSQMIKQFGLTSHFAFQEDNPRKANQALNAIHLLNPLGYLDFLNLMMNSRFVLTDSGGIQEETTVLNVPCLTLREATERPVTVREGTNTVVGKDSAKIKSEVANILNGKGKTGRVPELWDGRAAERITAIIAGIEGTA